MSADDKYPELLVDLTEQLGIHLESTGIEPDRARAIAVAAAEHVREHWGGQFVYISKGMAYERRQIWQRMWEEFNGRNHAELSMKFGYGIQAVYKILALKSREAHARNQGELFAADSAVATGQRVG